jgi:hypothetical protein
MQIAVAARLINTPFQFAILPAYLLARKCQVMLNAVKHIARFVSLCKMLLRHARCLAALRMTSVF